jgi:uncharacterized protein
MSLELKVMEQLKTAMKEKDEKALRALRAIKAAIINVKTSEGAGGVFKEEDELKMLQKLVKQQKDSITIFLEQNRAELAQKEQEEVAIIEQFLPKQLGEDELKTIIAQIVKDAGATSAADMGKVMGIANKQLGGQADGKAISTIVKSLLA